MSNNEEDLIKPYKIERVCEPRLDVEQLVLGTADTTESVYTRTLILLQDASLPDAIQYSGRPKVVFAIDQASNKIPENPTSDPDSTPDCGEGFVWDPLQKRCVQLSQPGIPRPGPTTTQSSPDHFSWDLFLMVKYREDWRSVGYGVGELLYSISLLPNEELTMEVKTWETSKTQQDTDDTTESRNVSDIKTTSSDANENTTEHQTKEKEYVDAKAGYSGFGFSASVDAGWSQETNDAQKDYHKQVKDRSEQASNEYKATHKVRLSLSRETGSESKTTRKIKNINQTRTLNTNFYEVLRQYEVKLFAYEVTLVLLGAEPVLANPTNWTWGDPPELVNLGQMIRFARSAAWVQDFTDRYGVSPIKWLRKQWSVPLFDGTLSIEADWLDPAGNFRITPDKRQEFANMVLRHVRPTPGWIEPDGQGLLRWGYEVIPGHEKHVLKYLYAFLPGSVKQLLERAKQANVDPATAYLSIASRYAQAVIPDFSAHNLAALAAPRTVLALAGPPILADTKKILVPGAFKDVPISALKQKIATWVDKIKGLLESAKNELLDPRTHAPKLHESWAATLPTHGVYADVALGVCSGAEDYYEIQRQFDLEMRRLEVEKLRLENARLAAGNPTPTITVENPTDKTTINVDVAPTPPSRIEIRERGR